MDQFKSISLLTGKHVKPDYYNAAAAMARPRKFPSPVNDPDWLAAASAWFTEGRTCLEIGPGRGEFAQAALSRSGAMKRYYIVDMSRGMIELVRARIGGLRPETSVEFICADIDEDALGSIPDRSVDRAIMVNVFQDLQPVKALGHLGRIIAKGGLLWVNMSDREVRDSIRTDDEFFDEETGCFYMTRPPLAEKRGDVPPLGFIIRDGEQVPFYRILKSYYRSEIREIFQRCGFEIIDEKPMVLPRKVWMDSNKGRYSEDISRKKMEILDKYGGYPGKIDVIAKKSG